MKSPSRAPLYRRKGWRVAIPGLILAALVMVARAFWTPGLEVRDGRHDLGRNALWLQHGWIGADSWFVENDREWKKPLFRADSRVRELADLCARNRIRDLYPHLCPTQNDGSILAVDDAQLERFLANTPGLRVWPWIGGPLDSDVTPGDAKRRGRFIASVRALLQKHPRLAGVHLNIEPWPSGQADLLRFMDDLRAALPRGKRLSVAAYPPPSRLHPFPEIHWERAYFRAVASRADQVVVMMYDTSLRDPKMFTWLYAQWTKGVLGSTRGLKTEVLFGLPTYDDAQSGYHNPSAENLGSALGGLHRGLSSFGTLPGHYAGAAIYSEWETDASEWKLWRREFAKSRNSAVSTGK